ncbi:hypothetical protein BBJ41_31825 [Burkholderia stabilis]|uniref:hypothetical protein n=1 Tax=Burkholderia stabilis TaxID=95485 RepID=UPI000851D4D2|nr:hypothetical protein [Burkholderia stabilis]AOR72003.1 hypothetical protein BBJ41_31825 [Burkholderia stabilis]HDR9488720.1 hypothetical protein [Burkholderia stabilis]HDR9523623.1 hypothetical protein [Burkholderia stabilis]HDR9531359.1 hypothetical protein [Burkholderia stabilis]HDR9540977.1 hypothetical protein [Burkholderia stabilis]
MTLDDFLTEAHRLVRPCRQYRFADDGAPVTGYWHGIDAGALCVSVERDGTWLNVYLDEHGASGRVETSAQPVPSERPLCRSDATSLPPIEAVFRFGSAAIDAYLSAHGWQRDWGFNDNFKGVEVHDYAREWMRQCPLYTTGVVAVAGGWHVPWPDDDWDDLAGLDLVLWTFEESEPWVEVFSDGSRYSVIQRIT